MVERYSPAPRRKPSKTKRKARTDLSLAASELGVLRGRVKKLTESNRQKDLSLSKLAHELRTPLGVIRCAAEMLRIRSSGHDEVSDSIDQQVDELARLIDKLLNPTGARPPSGNGKRAPEGLDGIARPHPTWAVNARRRILAVDDNRDAAEGLAVMLRLLGHEVHVAYDAEEALRAAAKVRPELVMLDLGLPNVSGYQLARRIRKQSWGASTRLIAVTGWGSEIDKRRAREAGFDDHLLKPVDAEALRKVLI
jgi:CheY-like chemotaxis protein